MDGIYPRKLNACMRMAGCLKNLANLVGQGNRLGQSLDHIPMGWRLEVGRQKLFVMLRRVNDFLKDISWKVVALVVI